MSDYFQMFVMMVACSFAATLILCARDTFRWRRFRSSGTDAEEEPAPDEERPRQGLRWWQGLLLIVILIPLAVVIIPVLLGAAPALALSVNAARYRWVRRAVRRLLRRRGIVFTWLLSYLVALFVVARRWLRYGRIFHHAA